MEWQQRIEDAYQALTAKTDKKPQIGMILGSGLGDYAEELENAVYIPYSQLPGFPVSTVEGHAGRFVIGEKKGRTIIAMQGRFHYYEGYSQQELTMPVRMMKKMGVQSLLITNAAGGVNTEFNNGALMLISDHINYSGSNPLIGKNLDAFGTRFPDMSYVYHRDMRQKTKALAQAHGIDLQEGVYMMFSGPCYETPAEVRMARILGADAVGMSTVPEAIVAAHCGIQILGISCITNMAAGILDQPLQHQEVMDTVQRIKSQFIQLVDLVVDEVL